MKFRLLTIPIYLLFLVTCEESKSNVEPTVNITSPESGDIITRGESVYVSIEANDEDGQVIEVRISIDEEGVTSLEAWPYYFEFETADMDTGLHSICAEAIDNEYAKANDTIIFVLFEPDTIPPNPPTGIAVTSIDDTMQITWETSVSEDVSKYFIYRSSTSQPITLIDSVGYTIQSYSDLNLELSQVYCYQISAYDYHGNEGVKSSIECATYGEVELGPEVAYYPFNGNAMDLSENSNHGTVVGATLTTDRFGNSNQAYAFDGDDYIEVASSSVIELTSQVSLSTWVSHSSGGATRYEDIVMKGNTSYGFQYSIDGSQFQFQLYIQGGGFRTVTSGGITLVDNTWYHIVGTYDGTHQKLYVNGVLQADVDVTGSLNVTSDPLYFGYKVAGDNNWLMGSVDNTRIYDYALGIDEVAVLYTESP